MISRSRRRSKSRRLSKSRRRRSKSRRRRSKSRRLKSKRRRSKSRRKRSKSRRRSTSRRRSKSRRKKKNLSKAQIKRNQIIYTLRIMGSLGLITGTIILTEHLLRKILDDAFGANAPQYWVPAGQSNQEGPTAEELIEWVHRTEALNQRGDNPYEGGRYVREGNNVRRVPIAEPVYRFSGAPRTLGGYPPQDEVTALLPPPAQSPPRPQSPPQRIIPRGTPIGVPPEPATFNVPSASAPAPPPPSAPSPPEAVQVGPVPTSSSEAAQKRNYDNLDISKKS